MDNSDSISLPSPEHQGAPFEEVLEQRRSERSFSGSLTLEETGALLFSGQGITGTVGRRSLRAAPSAGATYPFTLYAVINDVEGLEPGLYRYEPEPHALTPVRRGALGASLRAAALGQRWVEEAGLVVVMAARYERTTDRYGERGVRYVHMEAGHISQNLYLQTVSLGLGSVAIGAFDDAEAARVLGIESPEKVVYLQAIGRPR